MTSQHRYKYSIDSKKEMDNNMKDYFHFITKFNEKHYLQHYEIKKNWITYDMGIKRLQIRNL